MKNQGISCQTKSGHPDIAPNKCTRHKQVFYSSIIDCTNHKVTGDSIMVWVRVSPEALHCVLEEDILSSV